MLTQFNEGQLLKALDLLAKLLEASVEQPIELVVCGGSALVVTKLISRTTKDIDILALKESGGSFIDPDPLPEYRSG